MDLIRNAKCTCGALKVNEEHAFKCPRDGGRSHRHKSLQLAVMAMLKHAGIVTSTEDTNLVIGNGQRRETDVMGHGVKLDNSWFMEIGADVTVVSPNLGDQRSTRFHGIAAKKAEGEKRKFDNTEANLRIRGMHFFPLAVEMDGRGRTEK